MDDVRTYPLAVGPLRRFPAPTGADLVGPRLQDVIPGADGPVGALDGLAQPVELPRWISRLLGVESWVTARTGRLVAGYALLFAGLELLCWSTR